MIGKEKAEGEGGEKGDAPQAREHNNEGSGRLIFAWGSGIFQIILLALFGIFVEYGSDLTPAAAAGETNKTYKYFPDAHMMVFVGFGFLMTFLKKYGGSAVGFNFYMSALAAQWAVLVNSFWHQAHGGKSFHNVKLGLGDLLEGDFAAASVMISFGAVLGKASSCQLFLMTVAEVVFYGLNKMVIELALKCVDVGGSMVIHAFGAYFGLGVSYVLSFRKPVWDNPKNGATPTSDTFAMIGTLFLWMLWPSFNTALCPEGPQQNRALVNTILSLCAACVVTFVCSTVFRREHKLSMVDVQNASLAGGVAMGSSANLAVYPAGAIGIGMTSGILSVVGYNFVMPLLERIGLHDTCGVNNLHGMPGLLGSIISAIVIAANKNKYGDQYDLVFNHKASKQAGIQVAGAVVTFAIAVASGVITGFLLRQFNSTITPKNYFSDELNWEEDEVEEREKDKEVKEL